MVHTRRGFMRVLPAVGAAPAVWSVFASSLQAAAAAPSQEKYWGLVREQFPVEPGLTYLNAANVCPASRLVLDRYQRFLLDFHSNPSFQNREKYKPAYEQLRSKLAAMIGATPDEIAITRNTSEGSATIVKGLDLKRGDEIVITDHNHPSNNDAWKMRARRE